MGPTLFDCAIFFGGLLGMVDGFAGEGHEGEQNKCDGLR